MTCPPTAVRASIDSRRFLRERAALWHDELDEGALAPFVGSNLKVSVGSNGRVRSLLPERSLMAHPSRSAIDRNLVQRTRSSCRLTGATPPEADIDQDAGEYLEGRSCNHSQPKTGATPMR